MKSIRCSQPWVRAKVSRSWAAVGIPVLAVVGAEDTLTPEAEARRIAESVPDGRLVVIPKAGHLSNLENPKAFGDALEEFLAEVDRR